MRQALDEYMARHGRGFRYGGELWDGRFGWEIHTKGGYAEAYVSSMAR